MSLVPVDTTIKVPPPDTFEEPPAVAITPCEGQPARYYFEGGLRRVHPYHYTYNTYCKERWRNRSLIDIFTSEFRDREPDYYKKALESGHVCVNGKPAGPDTVLKNGEVISHTLHRHEPPVTGNPIGIIHESDDLLVIDKPAGVPVHSTGRYHYNSVMEILRIENAGAYVPRPCNRLDRLTSGVMFFGKTTKGADRMTVKLRDRTVQKEYVARVKGYFPDGVTVVDQPIMSVSPKVGLNRVRATGKEARTKFRRLAYYPPPQTTATPPSEKTEQDANGNGTGIERPATPPASYINEAAGYSIVHCLPLTGRTHQIRVHLQFLGHPISNDPIYSNTRVFGPSLGKNDASSELDNHIIDRLMAMGRTEIPDTVTYKTHFMAPPVLPPGTDEALAEKIMAKEHEVAMESYVKRKGERLSGENCETCGTELYTDPGVHELGIFLHAVAYADQGGEWKYRSKMPSWALPPRTCEGPTEAPEWVDVSSEEENVVGDGVVREFGNEEEVQAEKVREENRTAKRELKEKKKDKKSRKERKEERKALRQADAAERAERAEREGAGSERIAIGASGSVMALVAGIGMVDISGLETEEERHAAIDAVATERGV
ncbi:pseudouridine synthase family protein [Aspergillus stella-maris]|uniref:pseudouridine synthase family protein n=1 Tax=Aspergillus stella-maris TaxID=1810926 RepID=UPI003CCD4C7A